MIEKDNGKGNGGGFGCILPGLIALGVFMLFANVFNLPRIGLVLFIGILIYALYALFPK